MMARWFVVAWGALFMCLGFWVLIQPRGLVEFADLFLTSTGLWVAVALRLVVGVLLWTSAGVSRTPRVLKVLGACSCSRRWPFLWSAWSACRGLPTGGPGWMTRSFVPSACS